MISIHLIAGTIIAFLPYGVAAGDAQSPPHSSLERLLDAIEQVESGGKAGAIGDGGQAVGAYQLWPVYVKDANRIAGTKYTLSDRYDRNKSREITRIVLAHYGKNVPFDKWAVIHIDPGKRKDWDRPAAKEYLRKINEAMKRSSRLENTFGKEKGNRTTGSKQAIWVQI